MWISQLVVISTKEKNVWVNDQTRILKQGISDITHQSTDKENLIDFVAVISPLSQLNTDGPPGIIISEVFSADSRGCCAFQLKFTKKKEMEGLLRRRVLEIVLKKDTLENARFVERRFVLAIKIVKTDKDVCEARFNVQGHTDIEKNMIFNN